MYRKVQGSPDVRWYVADGLGSVVGEVDVNGVKQTSVRDVYGLLRNTGGGAQTSRQGFVGQSCGHMTDPETGGLVYMRARYYDPLIGRFASQDPAKRGGNWFAYCHNDPISYYDRSGKEGEINETVEVLADDAELDVVDGGPPSQLLYSTRHGAERFYEWFVETFGREGGAHNLDDALAAWDKTTAFRSNSGSWMCRVKLYNQRLILIAEDDDANGAWDGIGRLVTAYN